MSEKIYKVGDKVKSVFDRDVFEKGDIITLSTQIDRSNWWCSFNGYSFVCNCSEFEPIKDESVEIDLKFNKDEKVINEFLSTFDRENLENSDKQLIDDFVDNNKELNKDNPYEAIKIIQAHDLGFELGTVLLYVLRAGKKDSSTRINDLQNAKAYIDYKIQNLKNIK